MKIVATTVWLVAITIISPQYDGKLFCTAEPQNQPSQACHNERPMIGILAQKCKGKRARYGDQYFAASYVKFMESAGARVVPVKINQTESYYERLFQSLNGVVFPGGGQDLLKSGYANAARFFFRKSMAEFDANGDYFPILGICLGFEELLVLAEEERKLDRITGTSGVALNTKFAPDVESRLLASDHGISDKTKATWSQQNSTCHFHKWGMMKTTFDKLPKVNDIFKIVSTSFDGNHEEFVDIIEGHKYPFYGTQFHPEKNAFEWKRRIAAGLPHSPSSIRASQDFGNFFVDEVRQNCHRFSSEAEEDEATIYHFHPVETHLSIDSVFQQQYFFNVTDVDDKDDVNVAANRRGARRLKRGFMMRKTIDLEEENDEE